MEAEKLTAVAAIADDEVKQPSGLPPPGMSCISISAGNTHINWAFHKPIEDDLAPCVLWRTPHLSSDQEAAALQDTAQVLNRHLPTAVSEYIFGEECAANPSFEAAKAHLAKQIDGEPMLRIYVVSSSAEQTEILKDIWQRACPCIIEVLSNSFFFTPAEGLYPTMGADRAAALRGAESLYGLPALVIDGGTALTYSALDSKGNIMGGGISPGVHLQLRSLHEYTSALPLITPEEVLRRVQQYSSLPDYRNSATPENSASPYMNLFATDTSDAILVATLGQISSWLRRVIAGWLHVVGKKANGSSSVKSSSVATAESFTTSVNCRKRNDDRCVAFAGGDGKLLHDLVSFPAAFGTDAPSTDATRCKAYTNLQEVDTAIMKACTTVHEWRLIHFGVAYTLTLKRLTPKKRKLSSTDLQMILGGKVAKMGVVGENHIDRILYGKISGLGEAEGTVVVTFDNGTSETVSLEKLHDMVKFYGEIKSRKQNVSAGSKRKRIGERTSSASGKNAEPEEKPKGKRSTDPKAFLGKRIAKYFDHTLFFGSVTEILSDTEAECGFYFHAMYDDGDEEDLDKSELDGCLELYRKKQKKDKHPGYKAPPSQQPQVRTTDASENAVINDLVALGELSEGAKK